MKPKMIQNLSYEKYAKINAINMSKLKDIKKSPYHFWVKHLKPGQQPKDTDALRFGRMVHKFILESDTFYEEFAILPIEPKVDKRTSLGKEIKEKYDKLLIEFEKEHQGKEFITEDEVLTLYLMRHSLFRKSCAQILKRSDLQFEVTFVWKCAKTGVKCKSRLDGIIPPCDEFPNGLIIDLKTTQNASQHEFSSSAYKFGYHNPASFYQDGFEQFYGKRPPVAYIAIEKSEPFDAAFYMADEAFLEFGQCENYDMLNLFKECTKNQAWHGYKDEVQLLSLPSWAKPFNHI